MPKTKAMLRELWAMGGGDPDMLEEAWLTGEGPGLPSSFHVGAAAQASIMAAGLAAAQMQRMRGGKWPVLTVDLRHSCAETRSERLMLRDGRPPPPQWDPIAGLYPTGDGRHVRLHTNFPHHRDRVLAVLGCGATRADVAAALMARGAEEFETAATAAGCVVAFARTPDEWAAHPQSSALATLPLIEFTRIGAAPPRPLPPGDTAADGALAGLRVLDLTRVIAGPVSGRTLAAYGADVMLITAPHLPAMDWLAIDTGRGKLSARLDLRSPDDKARLARLLADADIVQQGYRPQSIAALGFSPEDAARIRPGIVYVSLSAYGRRGPWAGKRGYDSLVQAATGINHAEGQAAGLAGPKELPCQILDHATGFLMAFGGTMARMRQVREGGSWHVQVSLARTAQWLVEQGRLADGFAMPDPSRADLLDLMDDHPSGFGVLDGVRHAVAGIGARWRRPSVPLGTDAPVWPDETPL
jgi:crotonobetainyl-CoA:carnitine CoA-transferase CaiB-like acyl-CoA transferase